MTTPAILPAERQLRRVPMSYEEYLALPDTPVIVEWKEGEGLFHMPPSQSHQTIVLFLGYLLQSYVSLLEMGTVILAPFEVRLGQDGPSREPDIAFIADSAGLRFTEQRVVGAPDLLVEIVSPSSATLDRVTKFREYEAAGVREYWIIDPRPHQQQADFYVRDADGHFVPAPVDDDGVYASHVLPGFRLRVGALWATPRPNPQLVLAEIMAQAPGISDELRAVYAEMRRLLSQ